MPEPLLITTLIATIFTGITQLAQIYFDYRTAEKSGHSDVYKVYNSNCCSTVIESEEEK